MADQIACCQSVTEAKSCLKELMILHLGLRTEVVEVLVPEKNGFRGGAEAWPRLGWRADMSCVLDLQDLIRLVDDPVGAVHGHLSGPASCLHLHTKMGHYWQR